MWFGLMKAGIDATMPFFEVYLQKDERKVWEAIES